MDRRRRAFLIGSGAIAGAFAVGYWLLDPFRRGTPAEHPFDAYIKIGDDGLVTIAVPRAEMGQGVQTALATLVAEELDLPLKDVRVEHPRPSKRYINRKLLGSGLWFVQPNDHGRFAEGSRELAELASGFFSVMQITGGSTSVRDAWVPMRTAGATARAMLIRAAAEIWNMDAARLTTEQGKVVDPGSGRTLDYCELARHAERLTPVSAVALRSRKAFRLIGKPTARLDTAEKVNGKAKFGIDVKREAMLYAAVRSVPTLSGRLAAFDPASLNLAPGVKRLVQVDDRTVAAVADSYWTAQRFVNDLPLRFEEQNTWLSSEVIFADFGRRIETERGHVFRNEGDAAAQLAPGRKIFEAEYRAPYLAHACMEPLNCTAAVNGSSCELWLGTQAPGLVASAVARALQLGINAVTVNTTLLGGGFGRRLEADVAVQAALIAREFPGNTIKLIWSREEDMRRDMFRPAARAKLTGALTDDGLPEVLLARICSQSVMKGFLNRNLGAPFPFPDKTNAEGLFDQPYAIRHYRVEHVEAENEVPVGNWRSVGHAFNGFAMESFIDELAHEGGKDPLQVRRCLLKGFPSKQALLDKLCELSRWGEGKPAGVDGRGIAYRQNFESDVAQVVDIAIEGKRLRVKRVYCVIDCGPAVDPRGIEAQVESGIVYGLSAALIQATTIADGCVQQCNFHQFDALRVHQCPEIKIEIVQGNEEIGGAGETAVPPVAPALANAIFDATGRRLRALPLNSSVEVA
jgi:isoquinoline 1-oxidoreductase beta subunit